jgi:hypothetical protein
MSYVLSVNPWVAPHRPEQAARRQGNPGRAPPADLPKARSER